MLFWCNFWIVIFYLELGVIWFCFVVDFDLVIVIMGGVDYYICYCVFD